VCATAADAYEDEAWPSVLVRLPAPSQTLAAPVAIMSATTLGKDNYLSTNGLSDGIQLDAAHFGLEELQVATLHANDGKPRAARSLGHVTALTHKDFRHLATPFSDSFEHIPKIII